jgi:zinc protease
MKRLIRVCFPLLAFVACVPLLAADPALPRGVTRGEAIEGATEYRFDNGLRALLAPSASAPDIAVNLAVLVGSRHENPGETGAAHLLEHLIYRGTPTQRDAWPEFRKRGIRSRGTTYVDRTNYAASMTADDATLAWYLGWAADALVHASLLREDLADELSVVRKEFDAGERAAVRSLLQATLAAAYASHPYGRPSLGARSDVENADVERLRAFYRIHYQPDNAVIVVTGRFDERSALKALSATFAKIPRPARRLSVWATPEPLQEGERLVTLRRDVPEAFALTVYHVPAARNADYAAIELATSVLGEAAEGRLAKGLVEGGLASSIFAQSYALRDPGAAIFGAQAVAPPHEVANALIGVVEGLARQPLTGSEVDRARERYLANFAATRADAGKLGMALSEAAGLGDWRLFFVQRDRVKQATAEDVQRVAVAYLLRENRTLGVIVPTREPRRAPAAAATP